MCNHECFRYARTGTSRTSLQQHTFDWFGGCSSLLGSSADGNLYLSLHTADPGEDGDQTTDEAAYTNYARVAVPRTAAGWDVTNGVASLVSTASFPQAGATTPELITHIGIGTAASGAGKLLWSGALNSALAVAENVTPEITSLDVTLN